MPETRASSAALSSSGGKAEAGPGGEAPAVHQKFLDGLKPPLEGIPPDARLCRTCLPGTSSLQGGGNPPGSYLPGRSQPADGVGCGLQHVAAGIIWRGERFLAAKRPAGKIAAGFWEFPGGKREAGESIPETLARELREELGITCETALPWLTLTHDVPGQRLVLHFLHVTAFSGAPSAKDGQELRWVTPGEARALPFLPADRDLLAILLPPLGAGRGGA